jgi:hypothetical protein
VESYVLDDWGHRIVNRKPLWVAVEHLRRIAQEKKDCCEIPETGPQHLLLRRADTPDFFKRGGGAQIEGYGVSRRSVRNIEFLTWGLRIVRPGVSVYCAGEHSFWCQIRTFSSARAISGMWGAEWANVCWAAEISGNCVFEFSIRYGNLLGHSWIQSERTIPRKDERPLCARFTIETRSILLQSMSLLFGACFAVDLSVMIISKMRHRAIPHDNRDQLTCISLIVRRIARAPCTAIETRLWYSRSRYACSDRASTI